MKKHTLYGGICLLLGAACVALAAIALGTTRWKYNFNTMVEDGLFERCNPSQGRDSCQTGDPLFGTAYIRATQVLMLIGTFLSFIGLVVAMVIIFGKGRKKTHIIAGTLFLVGGLFLAIACSVYTGVNRPKLVMELSRFGYSLWMAWAATCVAFVAAILGFLAKTDARYITP